MASFYGILLENLGNLLLESLSRLTLEQENPNPTPATTGGGIGHGKKQRKPRLAVITVDGQDYRVPVEEVPAFLARMREELQEPAAIEKAVEKRAKTKKSVVVEPPRIRVKSAPVEIIQQVKIDVEKNNKIIEALWSGLIAMYEREIDEEETIILLLAV